MYYILKPLVLISVYIETKYVGSVGSAGKMTQKYKSFTIYLNVMSRNSMFWAKPLRQFLSPRESLQNYAIYCTAKQTNLPLNYVKYDSPRPL